MGRLASSSPPTTLWWNKRHAAPSWVKRSLSVPTEMECNTSERMTLALRSAHLDTAEGEKVITVSSSSGGEMRLGTSLLVFAKHAKIINVEA